jgi:hypothetical protein
LNHWHNAGLWDFIPDREGRLQRMIDQEYADAIRSAQQLLAECELVPTTYDGLEAEAVCVSK